MAQATSRSIGGASDEAGGAYRRGIVAFFAAHGLNGLPVAGLPVVGSDAVVLGVAVEVAFAVDDVLVQLSHHRLFIQAKRALRFGRPMAEVATQWLAGVRDPQFQRSTDWLGAAGGEVSGSVRALGIGLHRRRQGAASYSVGEAEAIQRLEGLLQRAGAVASEVDAVLSRGLVLELQVESFGEDHADRGRLLLDGHVVTKGEGGRAWRELLLIAGEAARLRLGYSIADWQSELRRSDLPLVVDATASRSGYLAARYEVLARYRQRLCRLGEYVDLTAIGLGIPPIPLSEIDGHIPVHRVDATDGVGEDLLWALRRRGRITLTGLPGGGKSTALRAVAAQWALRHDWSIPILVSLKKVGARDSFRKRALREQIIDAASESATGRDAGLLREALCEALDDGGALLVLDGLDEAAERSQLVARDIAEFLSNIHRDTDVLLATRDVAFADASMLQFAVLRLGRPSSVSSSVNAVLQSIAAQRGVERQDQWVSARLEWIKETLAKDSQLGETPLLPVLLASIAADHETGDLPRTRLEILSQVVEDVVRRSEAKRQIRIGGLPEGQQAAAVLATFPQIAVALADNGGSVRRTDLIAAIGIYLQREWGLSPGPSQTTAHEVLLFWDDSGMFVAQGALKTISARLNLFQEVGVALYAASLPDERATAWVASCSAKPENREVLQLAAGRSRIIADALIDVACSDESDEYGSLALVAANAIHQGGTASPLQLRRLIQTLAKQLVFGDVEGWRAFRRLAFLPVPSELHDSLLREVAAYYSAAHRAIATANAVLSWGWNADRAEEHLEAALRVANLPALRRRSTRVGGGLDTLRDDVFARVIERAAITLIPSHPDLAQAAAEAMSHLSSHACDTVLAVLRANGHEAIAGAFTARYLRTPLFETMVAEANETGRDIMAFLKGLSSSRAETEISPSQRRRLWELASYVETLDLNTIAAWMRAPQWHDIKQPFFDLVRTLAGFDEKVLAAEAKALIEELTSDPDGANAAFFSLFDVASPRHLTRWADVKDAAGARDLLIRVLHAPRACAFVAARALASHPVPQTIGWMIENELLALPYESVLPAVWALLVANEEPDKVAFRLLHSPRAGIREAVARVVPMVDGCGHSAMADIVVRDSNRQVRLAAIERAKQEVPSVEVIDFLDSIAGSADPAFTCYHCGTENTAVNDSCSSCRIVTRRPSEEAAHLSKELRKAIRDGSV